MFQQRASAVAVATFASALITTSVLAGPEWVEKDDAGSFYSTAQKTIGSGEIQKISGTVGGGEGFAGVDFEDMYLIRIVNPAAFSMSVIGDFDAQLFLFNVTLPGEAFGLLANDNTIAGNLPAFGNAATDGTGSAVNLSGVYAVAISGAGNNPTSINGNLFNYANPTEVSGPDGPGGLNPHNGWSGNGAVGSYSIVMTGTEFYELPAPGALALFGLAGVVGRPRRRS
jgi:uncharacterized protein (TIGR03382 family)